MKYVQDRGKTQQKTKKNNLADTQGNNFIQSNTLSTTFWVKKKRNEKAIRETGFFKIHFENTMGTENEL